MQNLKSLQLVLNTRLLLLNLNLEAHVSSFETRNLTDKYKVLIE